MRKPHIVDSPYAPYAIQVTLHYGKTRTQIAGNITLYKKSGQYGKAEFAIDMCNTYKCKGIFTDPFEFTESEREQLDQLIAEGKDDIGFWPPAIRERYTNWGDSLAFCTKCNTAYPRRELSDSYVFNNTLDNVSLAVVDYFRELGSHADLILKVHKHPGSLQRARQEMLLSKDMNKYAEELEGARENIHVYYPFKKLLKDMSAGASLEACVLGFLSA